MDIKLIDYLFIHDTRTDMDKTFIGEYGDEIKSQTYIKLESSGEEITLNYSDSSIPTNIKELIHDVCWCGAYANYPGQLVEDYIEELLRERSERAFHNIIEDFDNKDKTWLWAQFQAKKSVD